MNTIRQANRRPIAVCCLFATTFAASAAHATVTTCVATAADLQTALTAAQTNGDSNHIQVVRGYYSLHAGSEYFNSNSAQQLDITGGYNADCSKQTKNPALTVFDAGGESPIFNITSSAGVSVRYLTVQNGRSGTGGGGLRVVAGGGIIVDYNIIRGNTALDEAGLIALLNNASSSADVHIDGNLIADNSVDDLDAAGYVSNEGTGSLYFTNNTVTGNMTMSTQSGRAGGMNIGGSVTPGNTQVSNNIAWNNNVADFRVNNPVFVDNDYQNVSGPLAVASTGNVHVDPQFSGASDFHLSPASPLLGAGTLTPAGNLPTIDIEGHPRAYNGFVDMGAYERGDKIFADGYGD